jgi:hypothetical protein
MPENNRQARLDRLKKKLESDATASFTDPDFAQPDFSGQGGGFNRWLESPEVQEEFARLAPEAAAQADEDERIRAWEEFKTEARNRGLPFFECDKNSQALSAMIFESFGDQWTVENLRQAWARLVVMGKGILDPNEPRLLSQQDEIRISRMAAQGDLQTALGAYLECRLPKNDVRALARADAAQYEEIFSKVRLQPLVREGILFTWYAGHPDIQESPELTNFFERFTSRKLVITFATLDEAYDQYVKSQEGQQQAALLAPDQPTQAEVIAEIEELPDDEVVKLRSEVLRERARRARHS